MTILLEIWFNQDDHGPGNRVLLETRPLADGERVPVTYALSWERTLIAAHERLEHRGEVDVWVVEMVDPVLPELRPEPDDADTGEIPFADHGASV